MVPDPNRGQVEADILAALGRLDEHADPPFELEPAARAHLRDPRQHRVGALRGLDRKRALARDDRALPDIERRQRLDEALAKRNVDLQLGVRRRPGDGTQRREQLRGEIGDADDVEPLGL